MFAYLNSQFTFFFMKAPVCTVVEGEHERRGGSPEKIGGGVQLLKYLTVAKTKLCNFSFLSYYVIPYLRPGR